MNFSLISNNYLIHKYKKNNSIKNIKWHKKKIYRKKKNEEKHVISS